MSESTGPILTQAAKADEATEQADASIIGWYTQRATELEARIALSVAITEWAKTVEAAAGHLAILERRAAAFFGEKEAA